MIRLQAHIPLVRVQIDSVALKCRHSSTPHLTTEYLTSVPYGDLVCRGSVCFGCGVAVGGTVLALAVLGFTLGDDVLVLGSEGGLAGADFFFSCWLGEGEGALLLVASARWGGAVAAAAIRDPTAALRPPLLLAVDFLTVGLTEVFFGAVFCFFRCLMTFLPTAEAALVWAAAFVFTAAARPPAPLAYASLTLALRGSPSCSRK